MAEYTLPDLDWDYAALEPHISGQINEIHHNKHHATYVKGLNDAIAKLDEAHSKDNHDAVSFKEKTASHLETVNLHLVEEPVAERGDKPTRDLARPSMTFGSFDKFRAPVQRTANGLQGRAGQYSATTLSATSC